LDFNQDLLDCPKSLTYRRQKNKSCEKQIIPPISSYMTLNILFIHFAIAGRQTQNKQHADFVPSHGFCFIVEKEKQSPQSSADIKFCRGTRNTQDSTFEGPTIIDIKDYPTHEENE